MHAGFGAQGAVGVFALDLDAGGLDAGHVAVGFFQQFGLEALAFAVFQVLAQQHRRPVAGFGAAGAGLDVDEAVAGVGRVVEHAAEFQRGDVLFDGGDVGLHGGERVVVVLVARHLEQFGGVFQALRDAVEHQHDIFQRFALAPDFLGFPGVVPEVRGLRLGGRLPPGGLS